MPFGSDDLHVLISYKQLTDLLHVASEIPNLRKDLEQTNTQLGALNGLYSELLLKVKELISMM